MKCEEGVTRCKLENGAKLSAELILRGYPVRILGESEYVTANYYIPAKAEIVFKRIVLILHDAYFAMIFKERGTV